MKKTLYAVAASALFSVAGLAGAAEPVELTENQMDIVSAGAYSGAGGTAWAIYGDAVSATSSSTKQVYLPWFVKKETEASTFNYASGGFAYTGSGSSSTL
jgi:hypothetical protein